MIQPYLQREKELKFEKKKFTCNDTINKSLLTLWNLIYVMQIPKGHINVA